MCIHCFQYNQAQIYEIGVLTGGLNVISDIGSTAYVKPNQAAIGGLV
mgnify:FL=1